MLMNHLNKGIQTSFSQLQSQPHSHSHSHSHSQLSRGENTLLFFNYHEIPATLYNELDPMSRTEIHDTPLIITHFPNYLEEKAEKRIVRVPRIFHDEGWRYPTFSNIIPGKEQGAIVEALNNTTNQFNNKRVFRIMGKIGSNYYGESSLSPLSLYFEDDEFKLFIDELNRYLKACYSSNIRNYLEFFIGLFTFWLSDSIFKSNSKRNFDRLEEFLAIKSREFEQTKGLTIIPVRRSGLISLDFTMFKPSLPTNQSSFIESNNSNFF